jgi:hypothetical protein
MEFEESGAGFTQRAEETAFWELSWQPQVQSGIREILTEAQTLDLTNFDIDQLEQKLTTMITDMVRDKQNDISSRYGEALANDKDWASALADVAQVLYQGATGVAQEAGKSIVQSTASMLASQIAGIKSSDRETAIGATQDSTRTFKALLGDTPLSRTLGRAVGGIMDGFRILTKGSTETEDKARQANLRLQKQQSELLQEMRQGIVVLRSKVTRLSGPTTLTPEATERVAKRQAFLKARGPAQAPPFVDFETDVRTRLANAPSGVPIQQSIQNPV